MFNEIEREKALAIVRIFETGRVKPDYRALAVLNDGAGVSYGMFQFTHRSGALCDVVERYLKAAGAAGRDLLESRMPLLARTTPRAVEKLADDREFHAALRTAAGTAEMRAAQHQVAHVRYIAPALRICDEFGFVTPLALAAVLDGIVHGSFARFARLAKGRSERVRVSDYLRRRDAWLRGSVRLRATAYRTSFFLREAARGNWQLELPLTVNGHRLTAESLEQDRGAASVPPTERPSRTRTQRTSSSCREPRRQTRRGPRYLRRPARHLMRWTSSSKGSRGEPSGHARCGRRLRARCGRRFGRRSRSLPAYRKKFGSRRRLRRRS
ncbi:MAG: Chitosanase precursor [Acidobacteria bacterium OLB17]|nr:MAG: Chitosanase precursor [Acidobacteria bacterium OLB17]